MKTRDTTGDDLLAIVEIYDSTIPNRMVSADLEPVSNEDRSAWFHESARRPLRVTEHEGEVAGWLSLSDFHKGRPACHVTAEIGVHVREDNRGGGVGRRRLEAVIQRSSEVGLTTLSPGIVAHNATSVRLLQGFRRGAYFSGIAELDGKRRDLVIPSLKLDERP